MARTTTARSNAGPEPDDIDRQARLLLGDPLRGSEAGKSLYLADADPRDESERSCERIVTAVVRVEGPIHKEEIARRITSLWGLQRTGPRIAEAVARCDRGGASLGSPECRFGLHAPSGQPIVPVRDRSEVAAANLKKPEMIPPAEIRQAILHLVADHVGLRRDELPPMVVRALGFKATSPKLKDLIEKVLATMLEAGDVAARDQKLFVS